MRRRLAVAVLFPFMLGMSHVPPSGRLGVFALVEKVVFEPNEAAAERVQIWGAFAYGNQADGAVTVARKGYMYFSFPPGTRSPNGLGFTPADAKTIETVRKEWADLKAVAGTSQAVAFGEFFYFGQFPTFDPVASPEVCCPAVQTNDGVQHDLRVRPASEKPANPGMYRTNVGVVKLGETSHGSIIKHLKETLAK